MCPSAKCLSRFLLTSGSGPRLLRRCAGSGAALRLRDKRVNPVLLGNGDLLASGMLVENLFACGTPAEATPVTASDLHSPATRPLPCDASAHTPGRRRLHCCMAGAAHLPLVSCAGYLPVPTFLHEADSVPHALRSWASSPEGVRDVTTLRCALRRMGRGMLARNGALNRL